MRVLSLTIVVALASAACSSEGVAPGSPSAVSSSTTSPQAQLDPSGCPVDDDAFCGTAIDVATALNHRDGGSLVPLSRPTTIDCDEVAREYFPACASEDVLRGYGISGANFLVEVLGKGAYRQQLETVIGAIDPSYSDGLGAGSAQVLGVGTCGPDIPGRRTYHLSWTAAAAESGGAAERVLGSFELTFEDDEWRIALWYLDTLERWEAEQTDPLTSAFCEAGLHPWSS
jgi:hypothetical protein